MHKKPVGVTSKAGVDTRFGAVDISGSCSVEQLRGLHATLKFLEGPVYAGTLDLSDEIEQIEERITQVEMEAGKG